MNRRRVLLIGTLALLLMAVPVTKRAFSPSPVPGVTLENFKRLHDRMNVEEIEAILGGPASDSFPPFYWTWTSEEGTVHLSSIASKQREEMIGRTATFTTPDGRKSWIATASDKGSN